MGFHLHLGRPDAHPHTSGMMVNMVAFHEKTLEKVDEVQFKKKLKKNFGRTAWYMGSWFPDQGPSLCPLHRKHGVLITGPPGRFLK